MKYKMPFPTDQAKLWGHVASLDCQRCGAVCQSQVSHSNQSIDGKGGSLKAYPWRVAALCPSCHYEIDQGKLLSKQGRKDQWDDAHRRTIGELFARGLVRPI